MTEEKRVIWGVLGLVLGAVVVGVVGKGKEGVRIGQISPRVGVVRTRDDAAATEGERVATVAAATTPGAVATTRAVVEELPQVVRVGDETVGLERRMKRVVMAGGVYVTYDDFRAEWYFKEGTGRVVRRGRPAGVVMGEAAVREALGRAGAIVVQEGEAGWPDVGRMEVVDPAAVLEEEVPAASTGWERTLGEVVVGVNRVVQAEDGTFFVVMSETWKGGAGKGELPVIGVEAVQEQGKRWSAGVLGQIDVEGRRVVVGIAAPAVAVAGDHRLVFDLVVGSGNAAQRARVEMTLEVGEMTLRAAADGAYRVLARMDGVGQVTGVDWTEVPTAGAGEHRPLGAWTRDGFVGRVLREIADWRIGSL